MVPEVFLEKLEPMPDARWDQLDPSILPILQPKQNP